MNIKKALLTTAVTVALGVSSVTASAFEDFTISESILDSGNLGTTADFTADKINGTYSEVITFDGVNFSTHAFADFGLFVDDGAAVDTDLTTTYEMYALFDATGSTTATGFTGATGSFSLYLDLESDTVGTLGALGTDSVALSGNSDDLLIAGSSSLLAGTGIILPPNPVIFGAFGLLFDDVLLTADGEDFFISPDPFYLISNITGDFDQFSFVGTQTVTGDVSVVFRVPEPGMLGLMGIALLGLGLSRRKA